MTMDWLILFDCDFCTYSVYSHISWFLELYFKSKCNHWPSGMMHLEQRSHLKAVKVQTTYCAVKAFCVKSPKAQTLLMVFPGQVNWGVVCGVEGGTSQVSLSIIVKQAIPTYQPTSLVVPLCYPTTCKGQSHIHQSCSHWMLEVIFHLLSSIFLKRTHFHKLLVVSIMSLTGFHYEINTQNYSPTQQVWHGKWY